MASWKTIAYGALALGIIIFILVLNFDYLPGRQIKQQLNHSTNSGYGGNRPTSSSITSSKSTTFTPKFEDSELSLEDYKTRTWNCSRTNTTNKRITTNTTFSFCYDKWKDPYMCFVDPVHCKHPHASAKRYDRHWPRYGEYAYLPRSKWFYITLHGGVVFLYNPCAAPELIVGLKLLAGSCIRRHVITPYENLPPHQDFAIVTWGCLHSGKELNQEEMKQWIRDKAMQAPAMHVTKTGEYNKGLIEPAQMVSDIHETELCPSNESKFASKKTSENRDTPISTQNDDGSQRSKWVEHLSIKASENVVIVQGSDGKPKLRHKFDSVNAAWALGSLVFLCMILVSVMLYTRPWKQRDFWWRTDEITYNSNSRFNMLKNNWRRGGSKRRSSDQYRLLGPIPEECDNEI